MSVYVEWGDKQRVLYAQSGVKVAANSYVYRGTGNKGSFPRKKPLSLYENVTGHSASSATHRARPLTLIQQNNPAPQGDYQLTSESSPIVGDAASSAVLTAADISAAIATADAKVIRRMKDMQWNAAVSMAELPETMRFLAQSVRELWSYYRAARKGDFLLLAEMSHNRVTGRDSQGRRYNPPHVRAANRYLAWRMAVRPIVSDIDSVVSTTFGGNTQPLVRAVRGTGKAEGYEVVSFGNYQGNPAYPITRVSHDTLAIRRCVYVKVDPGVSKYKSLGLTNLASVLWELTPYSFLVDRILPIGQLIQGMDAEAGLSRISDYRAQKRDGTGTVAVRDCFVNSEYKSYSRQANLGMPPLASSIIGSYTPNVDAQGLGDALAILVQLRNQRPKKGGM